MIMKTTTNTGKNKKNLAEMREEKCRSHWNHYLFSKNFIYDPLVECFLANGNYQ